MSARVISVAPTFKSEIVGLQIFFNNCEAGYPAVVRKDCVTSRNSLDKLMLTHSPVERTEHAPLAYKSLSAENPTVFF